uniref:Uncharacterized protein n=1 Tax=Setaria viridis TaxID=4556 RepID=A0A4V6DBB6_SETVI|nr:hypothetical protein SEVIR_2G173700v2 [Setaria viridis]
MSFHVHPLIITVVDTHDLDTCRHSQAPKVIVIIRHTILFKDRPKALISKPATKEKTTKQPAAD